MNKRIRVSRLHVAAAAIGAVCGIAVVGPVAVASMNEQAASTDKFGAPPAASVARGPKFPVNARGLTYGSGLDISATNAGPDLLAAYGVDGTFGYIRAEDRSKPITKVRSSVAPAKSYTIPLYDVDGVTVIGEFMIHTGDPSASEPTQ